MVIERVLQVVQRLLKHVMKLERLKVLQSDLQTGHDSIFVPCESKVEADRENYRQL